MDRLASRPRTRSFFRLAGDGGLLPFQLRQVQRRRHVARDFAVVGGDRGDAQPLRNDRSVHAAIPDLTLPHAGSISFDQRFA
jgi:hypothetical protein